MQVIDTKERLLDVAESLFAAKGVRGASLREITGTAGANLAAVNYHFGSKEGLLRAIVLRRAEPLNQERIRLLEWAEEAAGKRPPTVKSILHAFIAPVIELGLRHPHFPSLLGRVQMENLMHVVGEVFRNTFYETLLRFAHALERALPELGLDEIRWRLLFTVGSLQFVCCSREAVELISEGETQFQSLERMVDQLVAFSEAGMRAAPSETREKRG